MDETQRKAIREVQYRLTQALLEMKHAFERFGEAYVRSQNEERRQRELNRLRNRAIR